MLSYLRYRTLLVPLFVAAAFSAALAQPLERPVRVAVLGFGETQTAKRVAEKLVHLIASEESEARSGFIVIDRDQARAAAVGGGYGGSLNMTLEEARNLGAAIGCDFFFTGEAQTLRRSSSDTAVYFEAYASIFLVSARTGRLILWHKPAVKRSNPDEAERALLDDNLAQNQSITYKLAMRHALTDESAERAHAIEAGAAIIEVMAGENAEDQDGTRPPRPYRRLKPPYPEAAATAEIEATVDVLADIDEKGEVGRVEIARWAGYGLDESVLRTVKQMHFFPAMRDRRAVPMRVLLRYNFRKPVQNAAQ